ncbi:MAG: glycoside hydrolase family 15 protein [Mycobacteriales bacterium]
MRTDGYAAIGDYAVIGDGRTAALVARDASIDWMAVPVLDGPPFFAALLDAKRGGCAELAPTEAYTLTRRYLPATNVLETTFHCESGVAVVTDALNLGGSGRLPWTELARRVEVTAGEVELAWSVTASSIEGAPWAHGEGDAPVLRLKEVSMAVLSYCLGDARSERARVHGRARLAAGESGLLALAASADGFLTLPRREEVQSRLEGTIGFWRDWSGRVDYRGPHQASVLRSALALSLLQLSSNGAIAAAVTTSLPERIGGPKNWDYRFSWLRDASFTIDAMLRLGLTEEAHAALAWLLTTVEATEPDIHVFYTLHGHASTDERLLPAEGYRGSQPVRAGNAAGGQQQLSSYGDLLDAVWQAVRRRTVIDSRSGEMIARIADRVCERWGEDDSGLWELPELRQYTISKVGCWVALDRAVALADVGMIASRHVWRWRREREAVRDWVGEHCYSHTLKAFTFFAGADELDASVLLAARTGFCAPDDPRLAGTIEAVRRELGAGGPLLYRYTGMDQEEGAFLACSFWLAEALRHVGREEEAAGLLGELIGAANDVGLYSEMLDPVNGELLGNLPQGLSHLALILASTKADREPATAHS